VISEVLPNAVQVANRFHLLQNLIAHIKDIIKMAMPSEIFIRLGAVLDETPVKEQVPSMVDPDLIAGMRYDNSLPLGKDGQPLEFDRKNRDLGSKQYTEQAESHMKRQALILEMRRVHAENPEMPMYKLAASFRLAPQTVTSYVEMDPKKIKAMGSTCGIPEAQNAHGQLCQHHIQDAQGQHAHRGRLRLCLPLRLRRQTDNAAVLHRNFAEDLWNL
jgi:hypothetical protein